jgi:hypothetical protein
MVSNLQFSMFTHTNFDSVNCNLEYRKTDDWFLPRTQNSKINAVAAAINGRHGNELLRSETEPDLYRPEKSDISDYTRVLIRLQGPRARVTTIIRGREIDRTDLNLYKEYLDLLPEEFRQEDLLHEVQQQRFRATAFGKTYVIDSEFLEALPNRIRDEILLQLQLAMYRRRRKRNQLSEELLRMLVRRLEG